MIFHQEVWLQETMRLIVEAKTLFAAPGFLIDAGSMSPVEVPGYLQTMDISERMFVYKPSIWGTPVLYNN